MSSVTVTIGRNVGDEPMSDDQWQAFGRSVREALDHFGQGQVWVDAAYEGSWEGVTEEARVFLAGVADSVVPETRERLSALAGEFGQDAIGLSVGTSELLHPALSHLPVRS